MSDNDRITTVAVRMPEELRDVAKVEAARRRTTLSALVVEGLTNVLRQTMDATDGNQQDTREASIDG